MHCLTQERGLLAFSQSSVTAHPIFSINSADSCTTSPVLSATGTSTVRPLVRSGTAYIELGAQMPCSQLLRSFLCPKNTFATNEISSTCSPAVDQIRLYLISLHGVNPKAPLSGSFGARLPEVHLGVAGEDGEADHVAMPHSRLLAGVYACRLQVACKSQGFGGSLAAVHGF